MKVTTVLALLWLLLSGQGAFAQTKVNIVHPGAVGPAAVVLLIALEQGIFAKHGIEAQLVSSGGPGGIRLTEEMPIGHFGAPVALQQAAKGADLKILATVGTGRISGHLVARPEVKKPEDLRDKRFGVFSIGTGLWINTIIAIEHLGLDVKRDNITMLEVGDLTKIAEALEAGNIDAAVLAPAQSAKLAAKGFTVLADLSPANLTGAQTSLIVTGAYLRGHPDVVDKVLIALIDAVAFSLSPSNKATVLDAIVKTFGGTEPAAAERTYQGLLRDLVRKPYPSVGRLRDMQRIMALHDPQLLNVKADDLVDDRLVRKLDESGMIDRLHGTYGVK